MPDNARDLLRIVAENAAGEFACARSLPPALYHDQDVYQLELEKLFMRGWICVGRSAELPRPGDFSSVEIADQPVFVIRQKDGGLRAFPNVCLHRCSRLLAGDGHVSKISCPYHSWTYDLSGQLVGAPFMQKTPGFKVADFRLQEYPCDVWQGFIYVSLNRNADSLKPQLAGLEREIDDFRLADYVPVYQETEVWNSNWKCLVENFMDVYHLHRVHADSFNKYSTFEDVTEMFPGEDAYSYMFVQEDGGPHSVAAHPTNTRLIGNMRHRTYVFNIFPSHLVQLQPDLLWYLSVLPLGVDRIRIRWAVSMAPEILENAEDREATIAEELDLLKQVNGEDMAAVERVFAGTRARSASQGPLSWLERNVWDFCRYLAREL